MKTVAYISKSARFGVIQLNDEGQPINIATIRQEPSQIYYYARFIWVYNKLLLTGGQST